MTLIRKLASGLFLALSCISFSNAQDIYTTGNIVIPTTTSSGSTWTNAVYQDSLTCWAWGNPGYCGPNPIVRPGDNINFSFGYTDIYQIQSISSVLPNSGTGLRVNGFNFGFTAKNGNGWDNGQQDYLRAYVTLYGSNSAVVESYNYDLNQKFNWTNFYYSETFKTPYATKDLSNIQYGFVGGDSNYWAGPYGPEIYNINFSLKYSVDPCATNVFYSPSCPGYYDALAKLAPASTTTTVTTVEYTAPPPPDAPPPPGSQPLPPPPPQPGPPPPVGSGPAPTQTSTLTVATTTTQEKTAVGPGLGFALNLIAKNSEREKAIVQQAVATSIAEAQAAGDKAQAVAISTANAAITMSTTSSESVSSGTGIQVSSSTNRFNTLSTISVQNSNIVMLQNSQSTNSSTNVQQSVNYQLVAPVTLESMQATQNFGLFEIQVQRQQEPEAPQQSNNFMTDRNNPLREIINSTPLLQSQQEQSNTTVNRNAQQNEAAAGVVLERMAVVPTGYTTYTNFALRDANFYTEKPLYANQRVIDNVRVLRGLGSDQKHQQMVQDQYR